MEILKKYFTATRKVEEEYSKEELSYTGTLPKEIKGTLFRNGNGRFEHQGVKYDHLFDGDGMITKFEFQGGKIHYSNRYVRTKEFVAEEKEGKMLYRSFGTNLPGGIWRNFMRMRFKNAANTSVIWHGEKMLALWEGGLPHEIDPVTLETIGRYDYDGVLDNDFSYVDHLINPELPFSAHPKVDHKTGILHNFGTAAGTKQRLLLYEVEPDGKARISQAIPMNEVTFTHDFVLTDRGKKIFFLTPVAFDLFKAFSGMESPVASIKIDHTAKTKVLVVDEQGQVHELETDFCFVFHFANGFDVSEDKIIVDGYIMEDFPPAEAIKAFLAGEPEEGSNPLLTRFTLDLNQKTVTKTLLSEHPGELPFVRPDKEGKPYRYAWNISAAADTTLPILTGLSKVDTQKGETLYKELWPNLPGEPVFVPKKNGSNEDDGWLLMLLFDAERVETDLKVLDAASLEEVASIALPHNIPLGFHGFWTEEVF